MKRGSTPEERIGHVRRQLLFAQAVIEQMIEPSFEGASDQTASLEPVTDALITILRSCVEDLELVLHELAAKRES
jgi:hypothetical protein